MSQPLRLTYARMATQRGLLVNLDRMRREMDELFDDEEERVDDSDEEFRRLFGDSD